MVKLSPVGNIRNMVKLNRQKLLRERFNISRWAISYPWLTLGFWIAVAVAGILAFSSLKYALFPDITFPVVVVNATAPISDALDTEAKLTKPIENSLNSIAGVDGIRSSTYPTQTVISLSFGVGTNLEESAQKVETALQQMNLPSDATYKVIPLNLNESAAVSYAITSSSQDITELNKLIKTEIVPPIAKLPGVLKVSILGNNNSAVRFNGKDALAFQVIKRGNANTLEVVSRVEKEVARLQSILPKVQISLAATQAEYIRNATQATIDALLEAIVLSIVIIYPFFRNLRATLISALAIPISLLGTFIVMAIYGFNLETITLLALALVIGSIIDDAIVDVENIMRYVESGETTRQAAFKATNEIGLTVTAATLTAVAVFLPIALMKGVIGKFFMPFGITVSAAMLTSLLIARTLSPVLAVFWIKPKVVNSDRKESGLWEMFAKSYQDLLQWSLQHKKIVMMLAVGSFVAAMALIPFIPKGFIPKLDRGEFNIIYKAPISATAYLPSWLQSSDLEDNTINESLDVAKQLEAVVLKSPEVENVFTVVGSRGEPNKGTIHVKLKSDRTIRTPEFQDKIRQQLPVIEGVTTSVEDIKFVDTGDQKPLQIALIGDDLKSLSDAANKIVAKIDKRPGFADLNVTGDLEDGNVFQIERKRENRAVYISANLSQTLTLGNATDILVAEAKQVLPPDVTLNLGGDSAQLNEVFSSFGTTLSLSALCILLLLIFLFKNWVDPVVICLSLPFALIGAILSLLITNSDFGMISLIGFVFLLGITNKNALLLVDYINQLRKSGLNRTDAILKAAPIRLRPIMMTTASTILGMVPIAVGLGAGSELRSPMAVAIAGGLISSTILSLIVVPVVYDLLDHWRSRKQF